MTDNLAHWISEHPHLKQRIEHDAKLERYLRRSPYRPTNKRVDDQTWNQITQQLQQ